MKPFKLTAVVLVSWWFLAFVGNNPLQVGPFNSSSACVNVAKLLEKAPGNSVGPAAYICFSSTGQTALIPLP